ncbi:MAG TPA: amidase family protein [Vicinamibacterales bacterium]|nr:amidase family protein [Vicinamibacterales bacterium]
MRFVVVPALCLFALTLHAQPPRPFQLDETTIAQVEAAFRDGSLTCRSLVEQYLARIDANDKTGASLNAIIMTNPDALRAADDLDRRYRASGPAGPLHCVPVIVKDNYETVDMPTSAGSLSLQGMRTGRDATVVKRLRDAGAVMIAKSNMAEFAFSPVETVSSILPGYTRNPYDTRRVTAGSSGGSAAAVAANFALVGLASDTGDSIRGPAAHQALVGLRSSMGLVSRSGVVPLNLAADVAGAVTRTVADTALVLQVVAGPDPADEATASAASHVADYGAALDRAGLKGARLGVLHHAYDTPTLDPDVKAVFDGAIGELRDLGADVIDPAAIDGFDALRRSQGAGCNQFKHDINRYLAGLGERAPMKSLDAIVKSRRFHPSIQGRLEASEAADDVPGVSPGCKARDEFRQKLREAVLKLMDAAQLDALIYPTWSNPPRLIGDLNTPGGDNNQLFAPSTGFPAITVPMGYTHPTAQGPGAGSLATPELPAGLQFLGRAWSEPTLIRLAYAYEQSTHHRKPPPLR